MSITRIDDSSEREYLEQISHYIESGTDESLKMAYEYGRSKLASDIGLLDVLSAHEHALSKIVLKQKVVGQKCGAEMEAATRFLAMALFPFELSRRLSSPQGNDLSQVYRVVEQESRRMAQRLHDDSAQMLALVYLELAEISRKNSSSVAEDIDRVVGHLDDVCEQLREISHEIHPRILDRMGLVPALYKLAENLMCRAGIETSFSSGTMPPLAKDVETAVYRTVQEALSNVRRHSGATKVDVRLRSNGTHVICRVSDNGCGLSGSVEALSEGLGLAGIRERVTAVGGRCVFDFRRGTGAALKLEVPL